MAPERKFQPAKNDQPPSQRPKPRRFRNFMAGAAGLARDPKTLVFYAMFMASAAAFSQTKSDDSKTQKIVMDETGMKIYRFYTSAQAQDDSLVLSKVNKEEIAKVTPVTVIDSTEGTKTTYLISDKWAIQQVETKGEAEKKIYVMCLAGQTVLSSAISPEGNVAVLTGNGVTVFNGGVPYEQPLRGAIMRFGDLDASATVTFVKEKTYGYVVVVKWADGCMFIFAPGTDKREYYKPENRAVKI